MLRGGWAGRAQCKYTPNQRYMQSVCESNKKKAHVV